MSIQHNIPFKFGSLMNFPWRPTKQDPIRNFKLRDQTLVVWRELGLHLTGDPQKVEAIERENNRDVKKCWDKVIGDWIKLRGSEQYPCSWDGMYLLLVDIGFQQLADEMKRAVGLADRFHRGRGPLLPDMPYQPRSSGEPQGHDGHQRLQETHPAQGMQQATSPVMDLAGDTSNVLSGEYRGRIPSGGQELENKISAYRRKNQIIRYELEKKNAELNNEVKKLKESLKQMTSQKEELEKKLHTKVQQNETSLEKLKEEEQDLEKMLADMISKEKELDSRIKDLTTAVEDKKKILNYITKEVKDAEKQLVFNNEKLEQIKTDLTEAQQKKDKLETSIKSAEASLEASTQNRQLQREILRMKDELKQNSAGIAHEKKVLEERVEYLVKQNESIKVKLATAAEEKRKLVKQCNIEREMRIKYYNDIEDMKGAIRVYCRVRPLPEKAGKSVVEFPDEETIKVVSRPKPFQFHKVFTEAHTQTEVFKDTENLIQSVVDGYNVSIFAYGQTGSGKTHTLIGPPGVLTEDNKGIAPRAFQTISKLVERDRGRLTFTIRMYVVEVYRDDLLDLLESGYPRLSIGGNMSIEDAAKCEVIPTHSDSANIARYLLDVFEEALQARHSGSTARNSCSSRSHLIIGLIVESSSAIFGSSTKTGKLSIVDLAGSERANDIISQEITRREEHKSAQDLLEQERISINKSLSCLSNVFQQLSRSSRFVSYRDHMLTKALKDSLGGNSKTLMFVNICSSRININPTVNSLMYADGLNKNRQERERRNSHIPVRSKTATLPLRGMAADRRH